MKKNVTPQATLHRWLPGTSTKKLLASGGIEATVRKMVCRKLSALLIVFSATLPAAMAQYSIYNYTGGVQTYTVPAGVTSLNVVADGAAGGNSGYYGGYGGAITASLAVTPGTVLYVYVGGQGVVPSAVGTYNYAYNGGGSGSYPGGAGGGGATDIRVGGTALSNRVIVAGGGGGGGGDYLYSGATYDGGNGAAGGLTGIDGTAMQYSGYSLPSVSGNEPEGGTQTAGGSPGIILGYDGGYYLEGEGTAGSLGIGGNGYNGFEGSDEYCGGGGGGYYGGGGAGYGIGGGGSSYTDPVLASNVIDRGGTNESDGFLYICVPSAGVISRGSSSICAGDTTTFSFPTGGGVWYSANGGVATVSSTGVVYGVAAGTTTIGYYVRTPCGITDYTYYTNTITVYSLPTISAASAVSSICVGSSTTLSATGGLASYSWAPSAGLSCSTCSGATASPSATTTYTVTGSNASGCSSTATVTVTVNPLPGTVPEWQYTGSADFSAGSANYTSMAIDGSGTPYVVYSDGSNGGKATVVKFSGGSWTVVGSAGFSAGAANWTTIAIDRSGAPYVAYEDVANGNKATVMKYDGSGWVSVGSGDFSAGDAIYTSIALDGRGNPYVAYEDIAIAGEAKVMKYDGTAWTLVGSGLSVSANWLSIAIDASGNPYVSYSDGGNGYYATVMHYNGASWSAVGSTAFSAGIAHYTSITLDGSGTPYVAYADEGNGGKAMVMQYTGSSWSPVGGGAVSAGAAYFTSLKINSSGTPYVAYTDDASLDKATVMTYNGSSWSPVVRSAFSSVAVSFTSLALDGSGTPYLAYLDNYHSDMASVMQLHNVVIPISGSSVVCAGSTTTLSDTTMGDTWSSGDNSIATVDAAGDVTGVSSGTVAINYASSAGCSVSATITVNALPTVSVSPVAAICQGGITAALGGLFGGAATSAIWSDGGAGGSFSTDNLAGLTPNVTTYTASSGSTSPVTLTLTTSGGYCGPTSATLLLTVNPNPTVSVVPVAAICQGGTTVALGGGFGGGATSATWSDGGAGGTFSSDNLTGLTPNLTTYTASAGSSSPVSLTLTTSGGYCGNTSITTLLTVNPLPAIYSLTLPDGGLYCAGGAGVPVGLSGSDADVSYQLYLGISATTTAGSPVSGTSSAISFGDQTAGTYVVIGTNTITGCTQNMESTAEVVAQPLPNPYAVTGSGAYCGSAPVGLSGSDGSTISYQLFNGTTAVTTAPGTGVAFSFGSQTASGIYTVTATNSITGCTNNMTGSATVTVNPLPALYSLTLPDGGLYCVGGAGVPVGLSSSDGDVSYQLYLGISAATTAGSPVSGTGAAISFGNQTAGTYVVIGTNTTTGCTQNMESTATIATTPLPVITASSGTSICLGGSATLSTTGGSTYSWAPAAGLSCATCSTITVSPEVTTTYTVNGTNAAGCSNTATVTVTVNPLPVITPTIDNATCYGLPDGYIEATASGSAAPYSYTWSTGGDGIPLFNNLYFAPAGVYTVTATDANRCSTTAAYTVTQPAALTFSATTANLTCYGSGNGSITTIVTGGTPGYNYLWSTGSRGADLSGLPAGAYTVAVTDANGCITGGSYGITQPAPLNLTAATANVTCYGGSNGSINTTVTGGTLPYSYHWSNGASAANLTSLAGGTYSVTVTDGHGCTTTGSYVISQPVAVSVTATTTSVTCNGGSNGSINTTVSSGAPGYAYIWSNGSHAANPSGLTAGTYSVTVTDERGCTATGAFTVNQPSPISIAAKVADVTCYGSKNGSITISVSGGTAGYTYVWSNGSHTASLTGLAPAIYTLTVTDAHGCTATTAYTVTQPAVLSLSATVTNASCSGCSNGSIHTAVSGGTPAYSYLWSDGLHIADPTGLAAGTYSVTVTDANGCTIKGSYTVTQPAKGKGGSRTTGGDGTTGVGAIGTTYDEIKLYPNPTEGIFSVVIPQSQADAEIQITDVAGNIIDHRSVTGNTGAPVQFSLNNVARGIYIVNVSAGDITFVTKLVVR